MNFFSNYRVWQTSGNILLGSKRYYGNRCASYKIISVTPNRLLKTQFFEKKAIFPAKKIFRPNFLVLSSRTDVREQFIKSVMHSDNYWASYKIISLGPTRSMEKISQKKGFFPDEKQFWSTFSRITEYGRPQVTCYQASQGIMAIIEQVIRSFL